MELDEPAHMHANPESPERVLRNPSCQMLRKDGPSCAAGGPKGPGAAGALNSVAETDFEEQMSELSEENHRLGQKVLEMERKLELKDEVCVGRGAGVGGMCG